MNQELQPHLGLATTRELLDEIRARGEGEQSYRIDGEVMAGYADYMLRALPTELLDYSTVKGRK